MLPHQNAYNVITTLINFMTQSFKRRLVFISILMLTSAIVEVISVGSVLPILMILTNNEKLLYTKEIFVQSLPIDSLSLDETAIIVVFSFIFFIILSSSIRILLIKLISNFSFEFGSNLSCNVFQKMLYQNVTTHNEINSSEIVSIVTNKIYSTVYTLNNFLNLITSLILISFIALFLIITKPYVAFTIFIIVVVFYWLVFLQNKNRNKGIGKSIAENSTISIKILRESLAGIREVLINRSQEKFLKNYKFFDLKFRQAQGESQFIVTYPKYILESLGIVTISSVGIYLYTNGAQVQVIPTIGFIALVAQRLLPIAQQSYASISAIKHEWHSVNDVIRILQLNEDKNYLSSLVDIRFDNYISFEKVSFKYKNKSQYTFEDLNLTILKGEKIGLVGASGVGKSTLIDLIMGLIQPNNGQIKIDGINYDSINCKAWHDKISYLPQNIFLFDTSIKDNILIHNNKEDFNEERYLRAVGASQLLNNNIINMEINVGENGANLSGGQKQRIGLARALYKDFDILILDESTNSLDSDTTNRALERIFKDYSLKTIIMISHDLNSLKICDKIYSLKNGKITLIKKGDV